jgi:hypothetical protein
LHELDNHHGTSFYRSEKNVLFITYKLKRNMSIEEIYNSIHKYFWFDKESKAGNLDKISGQVVHPPMEEDNDETDKQQINTSIAEGQPSGNMDSTKEVRIDGCNYELSATEIEEWIKQYGVITGGLEEIATTRESDGKTQGTGSYLLKVRLARMIPNIIPMYGLKIKCSYPGVKKQCGNCFEYHGNMKEKTKTCEKKTFEEYIKIFKENNPKIPTSMMNLTTDEDGSNGDDISDNEDDNRYYRDYTNESMEGKNEIDNEDNYFNYGYSYDFEPDWLKDT